MPESNTIHFKFTYKTSFWLLVATLLIIVLFNTLFGGRGDTDEVVMKRALPEGGWLYITRYGAFATDLDTLRFYISERLEGDDAEVLKQLNEASDFLVTDSALEDVNIQETPNGVGIEVTGAVYRYFSKEYLGIGDGENLRSYRITLTQHDPTSRH